MDQEGKFWFNIWSMAACFVLVLVSVLVYGNHAQDEKIVSMVKAGADPMKAACSLQVSQHRTICDLVVK